MSPPACACCGGSRRVATEAGCLHPGSLGVHTTSARNEDGPCVYCGEPTLRACPDCFHQQFSYVVVLPAGTNEAATLGLCEGDWVLASRRVFESYDAAETYRRELRSGGEDNARVVTGRWSELRLPSQKTACPAPGKR